MNPTSLPELVKHSRDLGNPQNLKISETKNFRETDKIKRVSIVQRSGPSVHLFAFDGDIRVKIKAATSGTFRGLPICVVLSVSPLQGALRTLCSTPKIQYSLNFPGFSKMLVSKMLRPFGLLKSLEGCSVRLVEFISTTPGTHKPSGFRAMAISVNKLTSKKLTSTKFRAYIIACFPAYN